MFYVYILKSIKFDRYYVWQTNNLEKRLTQHNRGYEKPTKHYAPFNLIYFEVVGNRKLARQREKKLKSSYTKRKLIISNSII